ncbi:MAG TPA: N-acetyl-1-D-myo-inositol-2-amino-2-deoxy-alpha-D-glucopyranoside deacetylase [Jatrophihabitantaceae bacterium]|nr:N-acetyl-1-D-myo-inositol-2-amino-2-deoxy-alpha-D-glucopyranoside deacetylase [Jatrophihabitantaceae bacterium]
MTSAAERRLLLVHAHPDDESIVTGTTMARYVAEGASVTLLTCTLGEEGEVLVPELALLGAAEADQLGGFRIGELADAMAHLGVTDHRFLGGAGRFRDSGMMGTPANDHPRAFWRADKDPDVYDAAVSAAVDVIREVRPQVVVTYDDNGDYGHPDHIMANRVATAAVERAADPGFGGGAPWEVAKLYWTATPKSLLQRSYEALVEAGEQTPFGVANVEELPFGIDDALVTTAVDGTRFVDAKFAALAAHHTQITVDWPFFALSNMLGREVFGIECFRLRKGHVAGPHDEYGRETDLFAGVAP